MPSFENNSVVITGMGMITSLGNSVASTWERIAANDCGIVPITLFNTSAVDCHIGGEISSQPLDRHKLYHFLDLAVHEAITASRVPIHSENLGVYIGVLQGNIVYFSDYLMHDQTQGMIQDYHNHALAEHLRQRYHIRGSLNTQVTACSASLSAIGAAYLDLIAGEISYAICGAAEVLHPVSFAGFSSLKSLDPVTCRPFDRHRQGLVLGEGAGVVILETLATARSRGVPVLGQVCGFGSALDGYHPTSSDPQGLGAYLAMQRALASAKLTPDSIQYVNAHGTGTLNNDAMEASAIHRCFGSHVQNLWVSSSKSQLGHTLGAAGVIETILTALAIQQQLIPPNLHLIQQDGQNPLPGLMSLSTPATVTHAMVNSFGFGGHMAALILGACS